jgi:RimJ/RimL family protein N-acetyltransferase
LGTRRGEYLRVELILRPWTDDDAPALSRAIAESLEHLRPWMPWAADEPRTDDERRAWIREAEDCDDVLLGMWLDGEIVGGCGLHPRIGANGLELGYWVHAAHLRRGIATDAVRELTEMAFAREGVEHVEIHHHPGNVASGRVAAAAGFTLVHDGPDEWRWRTVRAR